jgi:hypothetical protein
MASKPSDEVRELHVLFASLPTLVGQPFLGRWHTVDATKLPLFDALIGSDQNEYAFDNDGYPQGLVEGFHLLAMLDHLFNPLLRVTDRICVVWNYGFDHVRFVSPVCAGEQFRIAGSIGRVKPKGDGFLVLSNCTLEVKGRDRPGMVADWWTYWVPSASPSEARSVLGPASAEDTGIGPSTLDA